MIYEVGLQLMRKRAAAAAGGRAALTGLAALVGWQCGALSGPATCASASTSSTPAHAVHTLVTSPLLALFLSREWIVFATDGVYGVACRGKRRGVNLWKS